MDRKVTSLRKNDRATIKMYAKMQLNDQVQSILQAQPLSKQSGALHQPAKPKQESTEKF